MIRAFVVYDNSYRVVEIPEDKISDGVWSVLNHAMEVHKTLYPYSIYQDECYNGPVNELFKKVFNIEISGPVLMFYQGKNHVANVDYNFVDFPEEDIDYLKRLFENA